MSLMIKGMDMPTRCGKCRLKDLTSGGRWVCRNTINDKAVLVDNYIIDSRHPLCALSETHKPHGRLIDADKLYDIIETQYKFSSGKEHTIYRDILDLICSMETVIDAED